MAETASTPSSGQESRLFEVGEADAGTRLDRALAGQFSDMSRSRLQALIRQGHVTIGSATVLDPGRKVQGGERVYLTVPPPEPMAATPECISLDVVYEDASLIVINKPPGLVVHPAPGNRSGTLVNALLAHCRDSLSGIGGARRPGIVHRLDKYTSGLLVVAKTDAAHQALSSQFKSHGAEGTLRRTYLALVWGAFDRPRGTIDVPIARAAHNRTKMSVVRGDSGRRAVTHYQVLETFRDAAGQVLASLLKVELETGRTHQIRVHMAESGHPLLGDDVYGAGFKSRAKRLEEAAAQALAALNRQALHAAELTFVHPETETEMAFRRPLPEDMQRLVTALEKAGAKSHS